MSALKNKEKEPTVLGLCLTGLALALLGGIAGFLVLAAFPARLFSTVEEREEFRQSIATRAPMPGDVSFFEQPPAQGNAWLQQRSLIVSGQAGTARLSARDLNAWVRDRFSAGALEREEDSSVVLVPQLPGFAIEGGELFINLPVKGRFYGADADFDVHAVGRFGSGPAPDFQLEALYVNSAAVPVVAGIAAKVMDVFLKAYTQSEEFAELKEAWSRVESVELADGAIRVVLQ